MKNVFRIIAIGLVGTFIFASCNKSDDTDWNKLIEEQRIKDSIENARIKGIIANQAPQLKSYAETNFTNAKLDTATGIWYQVITEGEASSYTYRFNSMGNGIVAPEVTVKFKEKLINGTVTEQTETDKTTTYLLSNRKYAWHTAFLPKTLSYNNQDVKIGGLTANGLKKNSQIRFISPSPWVYDTQEVKDKDGNVKIAANSPIVYEIEVVDIK
ncbi:MULTISPECIES: FKBP-type peptidyl-prolyl cis-trans isomerase [unclassified Sphingobacterium]|uniref:FKBP-type peptidyl-prolyl cis-trans isomerase n=1 Tax=unclassified Sphingobacterium TaxID=2609468 RepID=UPI0025E03FC5|nr:MULTISPECIES: peptidylprolyl isomerase [unclassified Sphingobacterium]